jgi:hypothetical protein
MDDQLVILALARVLTKLRIAGLSFRSVPMSTMLARDAANLPLPKYVIRVNVIDPNITYGVLTPWRESAIHEL